MHFQSLLPLFLLILIPIVIIMYLLKQKAIPQKMPSLFLWNEMYKNRESDTPWEKFKKNKLLFIQLIIIAAMIFALMGPYVSGKGNIDGSVCLLIDNSGSMSTLSGKESRLEKAKSAASNFVDTLSDSTSITLIVCSKEATILVSNSTNKQTVKKAISEIGETVYAGDLTTALNLCRGLFSADGDTSIIAFTDTEVSFDPFPVTVFNTVSDYSNICIDYLVCGKKSGKDVVLVGISNTGDMVVTDDLNLYGDGRLLKVREFSLSPKEATILYFENLDFTGTTYKAEVNTKDAHVVDSTAFCLNNISSERRVLILTERNVFLEKAFSLVEGINITKSADLDSFSSFEEDGYDLYVFDGILPEKIPEKGNLLFINCVAPEYFDVTQETEGTFLRLQDNKINKDIAGFSFGALKVKEMETPYWAHSFIATDSYSAGFYGETDGKRIGVIGFDLHDTDFPLSLQYPIMMYNLINELANTGVVTETSLYCGDSLKISTNPGAEAAICDPNGKILPLTSGTTYFKNTDLPGTYSVIENNEVRGSFAVNYNSIESHSILLGGYIDCGTELQPNITLINTNEKSTFNYTPVIIAILLLALAVEWIVFLKD